MMQAPLSWISPATVQGRDRDGRFWAFLDEAAHPGAIVTGHLVVAGDAADPVVARVLDIVERRGGAKVAMELVGDAVERWHALTAPGSSPALTEAAGGGPTTPPRWGSARQACTFAGVLPLCQPSVTSA